MKWGFVDMVKELFWVSEVLRICSGLIQVWCDELVLKGGTHGLGQGW